MVGRARNTRVDLFHLVFSLLLGICLYMSVAGGRFMRMEYYAGEIGLPFNLYVFGEKLCFHSLVNLLSGKFVEFICESCASYLRPQ